MKYAILLGVSVVGHAEQPAQAINVASETSTKNPTRLVRIINTHDDTILFTYRAGQPQVGA
jgi:hypothetical protein